MARRDRLAGISSTRNHVIECNDDAARRRNLALQPRGMSTLGTTPPASCAVKKETQGSVTGQCGTLPMRLQQTSSLAHHRS